MEERLTPPGGQGSTGPLGEWKKGLLHLEVREALLHLEVREDPSSDGSAGVRHGKSQEGRSAFQYQAHHEEGSVFRYHGAPSRVLEQGVEGVKAGADD